MSVVGQSLEALSQAQSLSQREAYQLMDAIMRGEATDAQIGGVLMALRVRGETVDELTGFALAMRHHANPVPVQRRPLIDTCGTGGDRSFTFNVSTVSAFVVAASGLAVAKHGNRSATSKSGSADLLEALGVSLTGDLKDTAQMIERTGFGFLFAQNVHASMRHAAPTRRELGVRTVFNVLGPLTNPCAPEYQLVGVFGESWVDPVAQVLARLGVKRALVVHGHGGLDEVSLSGASDVSLVQGGEVSRFVVTPETLGLPSYPLGAFAGGDPQVNAEICRQVLEGKGQAAMRDLVLANAGMALYAGEQADSPSAGVDLARRLIDDGQAYGVLQKFIEESRRVLAVRREA